MLSNGMFLFPFVFGENDNIGRILKIFLESMNGCDQDSLNN